MKYQYGCNVIPARRKEMRSSSALALAVALALAFSGSAALAINNPIPGVDIIVKKRPGGIPVSVPTGSDGTYKFTGLAPGSYDLTIGGQRVQSITVGADRTITGMLKRNDDGTASISVGNREPVVLSGQIQSAAGRMSANEASAAGALKTRTATVTVTPVNDSIMENDETFRKAPPPNSDLGSEPTTRGIDVGAGKQPGRTIVIELSEPVPVGQLARTTAAPAKGGDGKPGISLLLIDEPGSGLPGYGPSVTAPGQKGEDVKPGIPLLLIDEPGSGLAGTAIPQVNITVFLNTSVTSRGIATTTDANGTFKFTKVPPGEYTLSIAGKSPQSVTVGKEGTIIGKVIYSDNHGEFVKADKPTANWDRWGGNGIAPPNTAPPKVVPGKSADKFDQLRSSGISGSPGSPGTPGSPGNFGGFGGVAGPGGSAMGPGAGSAAGPMGR